MTHNPVFRDERTVAIENASYRSAYLLLSFGLLFSIAYRSFVSHEQSWDLLALIVVGGLIASGYQLSQRILSRRWTVVAAASAVLAAITAIVVVLIRG